MDNDGCPPAKRKYPADFPDNPRACRCSILCVRTSDGSKERIRSTGSIPAVIPGCLTKILQPLDISVNKCFTTEMMKLWEAWMSDGEKSYTATGRMRRASYQTVCQWVKDALSAVPPYTIISRSIKAEIVDAPLPEEQAGPSTTCLFPSLACSIATASF